MPVCALEDQTQAKHRGKLCVICAIECLAVLNESNKDLTSDIHNFSIWSCIITNISTQLCLPCLCVV